jgi:Amt family ammonium transporter
VGSGSRWDYHPLKAIDLTIGLRVSSDDEVDGLDLTQHGEEGYYWEASAR